MSVIKRLGNLAKGTLKTWSDEDGGDAPLTDHERSAAEEELRRLEEEARRLDGKAPSPAAAPSPTKKPVTGLDAKRKAVAQAYIAGVLSAEERDEKLAAIDEEAAAIERGDPPKPRKRRL